MKKYFKKINSPVGNLTLIADDKYLRAVVWEKKSAIVCKSVEAAPDDNHPVLVETEKQLAEYFSGKRRTFELSTQADGTAFQKQVWEELEKIPYGERKSYRDIAECVGRAKAYRAVGLANSKNPLSIIVPCHRVVGVSGKLTGFAGGLPTKDYLLQLEHSLSESV